MVGLRESSNTALDSSANCVAALFDLRRRLNIDMRRIYFTGFSGRARQSAWEAIGFPDECAGIFCIGAGFSQYGSGPRTGQYKIPPLNIPVCFLVGKTDMNNKEVVGYVFPEEQKRKRVCKLIVHPGGHEWGPATDQETGLRWLNEQWKEPPPRSK
jgi:poly(3-hydroxybutyrate) depolymerase